jgi:hypothetical protein
VAVLVSLVVIGWGQRSVVLAQTDCDLDCVSDKMVVLTRRVVALEKIVGVGKSTSKTGLVKESFKNLGGGSATGVDWTKIGGSDFSFDQSLYGSVDKVTWQGWVENGSGSVRLFDSTNGRAVDGSEINLMASERASFYSSPLAIWRGQNQYYLQVRSNTGGSVTVSGARLRIATK